MIAVETCNRHSPCRRAAHPWLATLTTEHHASSTHDDMTWSPGVDPYQCMWMVPVEERRWCTQEQSPAHRRTAEDGPNNSTSESWLTLPKTPSAHQAELMDELMPRPKANPRKPCQLQWKCPPTDRLKRPVGIARPSSIRLSVSVPGSSVITRVNILTMRLATN